MKKARPFFMVQRGFGVFWVGVGLTLAMPIVLQAAPLQVSSDLSLPEDTVQTYDSVLVNRGATLTIGGGSELTVTGGFTVKTNGTVVIQGKDNTDKVDGNWVGEGVTIRTTNLTIESDAAITADGQGYITNKGPGRRNAYGASHGGRGGDGADWVYGSIYEPVDLGSACEVGYASWSAGGGAIKLVVDGTLQVDGTITANGMGTANYAGGSGGSIWVDTDVLRGTGLISAEGGTEGTSERSSGGGRVAVYYRDASAFSSFTAASVAPGLASLTSGEPGTLVFIDKTVPNWSVRVPQRLELLQDTETTYGKLVLEDAAELILGGGSELTVTGAFTVKTNGAVVIQGKDNTDKVDGAWIGEGVTIRAGDLTVETGSAITADGQGYITNKGPGRRNAHGASHGGRGGGEGADWVYGSIYEPVDLGSACEVGYASWSAGGGAIKLVVDGTLQVDGAITANGMGTANYAGGSGGSIWVDTDVLRGTGLISAEGGTEGTSERSSGGGRVVVYYRDASAFSGFTAASVAPGLASLTSGEPGTLIFVDKTVANWSVRVPQRLELLENTETTYGEFILEDSADLVLGGGAALQVTGLLIIKGNSTLLAQGKDNTDKVDGAWIGEGVIIRAGDLTIETGSVITADGQGYTSDKGPGNRNAYGASHGGRGGDGADWVYGSFAEPVDLGSACEVGWNSWSAGGGAIKLVVDRTLQLDGTITANGMGTTNYAGGSGGSIWIDTDVLSGSGIVQADSGPEGPLSRSSGGGRIAIYYRDGTAFTGYKTASVSVSEATITAGEAGTLLFVDSSVTDGAVRVSQRLELLEDSATTFGSLTVDDGAELVLDGGSHLHVRGGLTVSETSMITARGADRSDRVDDVWVGRGVSIRAGELVLEEGSAINADGWGYTTGEGPGTPSSGGASHGGLGGHPKPKAVYGSERDPLDLGSACKVGWNSWSAGGGAIKLIVDEALQLGGDISADGLGSGNYPGGSGGSIWMDIGSIAGAGSISANGWVSPTQGSAGGRIALYSRLADNLTDEQITVLGGVPAGEGTVYPGGDGTLVRRNVPEIILSEPPRTYLHGDETIFWKTYSINLGTTRADVTLSSDEQSFRMVEGAPLDEAITWDTRPVGDGWYELRLTARAPDGSIPDDDSTHVCLLNEANWHSGSVTGDEVWSADIVHVVDTSLVVENGGSITIEAGAVVKFVPGAWIQVADGGALDILAGPEQNAILTAIADDTVGGDTNLDGPLSLPMPGSWAGLAASGGGTINLPATAELRYLVQEHGGTLAASGEVWGGNQLHHVTANVIVPAGATLQIQEGAVVKFDVNTKLTVSVGASLQVDGRLISPVILTSAADDSVGGDTNGDGDSTSAMPGDWLGLALDGDAELTHTHILYAGGSLNDTWNNSAAVHTDRGADINFINCVIREAKFDGVIARTSEVTILGSVVSQCDRGINAFGGGNIAVVNTTVDDCRVGLFGHGGTIDAVNSVISNSISVGIQADNPDQLQVTHSNVWCPDDGAAGYGGLSDQTGINGNISADPRYRGRLTDDLRPGYGSPLIDAADGGIAPPTDYYGMVRYDDPRTANTGSGVAADIGAFEFVEGAASDLDLAVISVEGPESVLAGASESVRWTVRNLGPIPIRGPWRDRISLQPIAGDETSALEVMDTTVADGITLGAGQSIRFSKIMVVPAGVEGRYAWTVTTNVAGNIFEGQNRDNNFGRATVATELAVAELQVGQTLNGTFRETDQAVVYKIQPPAGADIAISLDRAGEGGWTRLVASEEVMPSLAEAELQSNEWNSADASLAISSASGGTYYIQAVPVHLPSSPLGFSLGASEMVFDLNAIGLESGSNRGRVTLPIFGTGLKSGVTASLIRGETTIAADEVQLVDAMHLYATFDLAGLPTGSYDVLLRQDGFARELDSAFAVTNAEPGELRTAVLMPEFARAGREFTAWIEYENIGGTDLVMPMVGLSSPQDVTMRLNRYGTELPGLTVLALGPEGPPWILAPGQMGRVAVMVKAVSGRNRLRTHPVTAESPYPMDWEALRDQIRPSHSVSTDWEAAWEMMVVDYGSTIGNYADWARDAVQLRQARTGRVSHNPTPALRYYLKDAALALQARLEGYVQLESSGEPLKGVSVTLYDEAGTFSDIAISENNGFVRFMQADAGSFDVGFAGYLPPDDLQPVVLTEGAKSGPLTWELNQGAKLRGSVLLPASVDREGLVVSASGPEGSIAVTGLDELGRYSFGALLAGNHTVTLNGDGVVTETVDGVVLTDGAITQGPIFSARAAALLSGQVLQASGDQPIGGARVVASDGSGNGGAAETAADGAFTIENLAPGTYQVTAHAESYAPSAVADVTVVSGSSLTGIDLALEAGARVSGKITAEALAVTGIFVAIQNGTGVTREFQTNASGGYSFSELPASDWTLTVTSGRYADHSEVVALATGEDKILNIDLDRLALLSATVHDGMSRIGGVEVRLTDPDGHEGLVSLGSDGRVQMGLDGPGEYVVSLLDGSQRQTFTIGDETSEAEVSFHLATGRLKGFVLAADGETPLAGVGVVLIFSGQSILYAETNRSGEYVFPNVAPGEYSVEFSSHEVFFAGFDGLKVENGETTIIDDAVGGSASLTVSVTKNTQVVDATGLVTLEQLGTDLTYVSSWMVLREGNTSVLFTDLSPGEYRLHAVIPGAVSGYVAMTVDAGENEVELPVYDTAALAGTIRGDDGDGLAGIRVTVYRSSHPSEARSVYTAEDGHFEIRTLLPGNYAMIMASSLYNPGADMIRPEQRYNVSLSEGDTTRVNAVMRIDPVGVSGRVEASDGSIPISGQIALLNANGVEVAAVEMRSDGRYEFPALPSGTYTLTGSASGFRIDSRSLDYDGTVVSGFDLTAHWKAGYLQPYGDGVFEAEYRILWGEGLFNLGWLNRIKSFLWEEVRELLNAPPKKADNLPQMNWPDHCECDAAKAKWSEALRWQKRAFDQWDNWNEQWQGNQDVLWSHVGEIGVNLMQFAISCATVAKDAPTVLKGLKKSRAAWDMLADDVAEGGYETIGDVNKLVIKLKNMDKLIVQLTALESLGQTVAGTAGSFVDASQGLSGTFSSLYNVIKDPASLAKGGLPELLNNVYGVLGGLNQVAGLINTLSSTLGKTPIDAESLKLFSQATAIVDMLTKGAQAIRDSMMAMEAEDTSEDLYYQLLDRRNKARDEAIDLLEKCLEECCDPLLEDCCDPEVEECCDPEVEDCCDPAEEECDTPPKDPDAPYGPGGTTNGIGSFDPNEKLTTGAGIGGFITPESAIIYTINFENVSSATAAAQVVTVTDPLPDNLDWSTVELLSVGFNGEILVPPMTGLQTWSTRSTVTSDPNPVEVLFEFDPDTGLMELVIQSVDTITGELPEDPFAGFLPPNDTTGRGEGFVSFLVEPVSDLIDGTQILNTAEIIFDVNEPIVTNEAVNTIDSKAPSSVIVPLSERSAEAFMVSWEGDDSGGAGVSHYDVYVSIDGGAWSPWMTGTEETNVRFDGERGKTYAFYVHATDSLGYAAPLAPTAQAQTIAGVSFLINISNRGNVGTGANVMIPGFVISGTGTKSVLVRAIGPTLGDFGVTGVLEDPQMEVYQGVDVIEANDNWGDAFNAVELAGTAGTLGAFGLNPTSEDAAILTDLTPGSYTVQVSGVAGTTGVALVELYDADTSDDPTAKLVNISNRGEVGTGASIMIPGFIVGGDAPKTLLIRGIGPKLADFGVQGILENPALTVYQGQTAIATNDDWGSAVTAADLIQAFTEVGAFALNDDSLDAAILLTLDPGVYTVQVYGVGDTEGVALVEVYEVE